MDSTHHGAHLTPQPHPAFKLSKYAAALPFKVPFEAAMRQLSNSLDAHLLLQKKGGGRTGQGERRLLRGRKLSHQGQQNQEKTKNLDCKNFLRLDPKHTYCPNKKKKTRFGIRRYIYIILWTDILILTSSNSYIMDIYLSFPSFGTCIASIRFLLQSFSSVDKWAALCLPQS